MTIIEASQFYGDFSELQKEVPWEPSEDVQTTLAGIVVAETFIEEIDIPQ